MSDKCFVCATPYQINAAIAISSEYADKSDMYILPDFTHAEEYANRVLDLGVFSNVYLVDSMKYESYRRSKNKLIYGFGFFFNYLRINKIVKDIVGDADYKRIYISTHHNIGKFICLYFLKCGAEVIYYDDGEGSYDNHRVYEAFGIEKIVRTLLFGKQSVGLSKKRILYCPELFIDRFGDSYAVSAIPNWANDIGLLKKIDHVCGYTDLARIDHRFVLLDTIPSEDFNQNGQVVYEELVKTCVDFWGNKLLIKKHPRDHRKQDYQCDVYRYSEIPFEVICANSDINNKVLISSGSKEVFTPKLLFDLEPTIILLNQIIGETVEKVDRDSVVSFLKNKYHDKSKIIIPKTIDELIDVIRSLIWECRFLTI